MVLVGGPNPDWAVVESTRGRAMSRLINRTMVSKPAPWVQTCLLKMSLLNLGPEWCFISSYPVFHKLLPKLSQWLLSTDGCQIIVIVERYMWDTSYFTFLLISCPRAMGF